MLPTEEVLRHGFGTVVIKLLVDAEATIIGTTVVRAPTARMGQAVLDAVKAIKPFVAAGMVDQEPVSVLYYLPIKIGHPVNGWAMTNAYDDAPKVTFLAAE
ncbi:energy transducer TonB [Hymenobacter siberiensis]|uniref:energy transducer TonB n=1 Tax=Hymenobacter siberiensis TaxID=2848396 RepID=UPI001C1E36C7|nr:energy transducer TonB [Hymenobacter siberiensis]